MLRALLVGPGHGLLPELRAALGAMPRVDVVGETEDAAYAAHLAHRLAVDVVVIDAEPLDAAASSRRVRQQGAGPEVVALIPRPELAPALRAAGAARCFAEDEIAALLTYLCRRAEESAEP